MLKWFSKKGLEQVDDKIFRWVAGPSVQAAAPHGHGYPRETNLSPRAVSTYGLGIEAFWQDPKLRR